MISASVITWIFRRFEMGGFPHKLVNCGDICMFQRIVNCIQLTHLGLGTWTVIIMVTGSTNERRRYDRWQKVNGSNCLKFTQKYSINGVINGTNSWLYIIYWIWLTETYLTLIHQEVLTDRCSPFINHFTPDDSLPYDICYSHHFIFSTIPICQEQFIDKCVIYGHIFLLH